MYFEAPLTPRTPGTPRLIGTRVGTPIVVSRSITPRGLTDSVVKIEKPWPSPFGPPPPHALTPPVTPKAPQGLAPKQASVQRIVPPIQIPIQFSQQTGPWSVTPSEASQFRTPRTPMQNLTPRDMRQLTPRDVRQFTPRDTLQMTPRQVTPRPTSVQYMQPQPTPQNSVKVGGEVTPRTPEPNTVYMNGIPPAKSVQVLQTNLIIHNPSEDVPYTHRQAEENLNHPVTRRLVACPQGHLVVLVGNGTYPTCENQAWSCQGGFACHRCHPNEHGLRYRCSGCNYDLCYGCWHTLASAKVEQEVHPIPQGLPAPLQ
eukprot:Platyproteum_vivax@DN4472_c0_g1_i2.p1